MTEAMEFEVMIVYADLAAAAAQDVLMAQAAEAA